VTAIKIDPYLNCDAGTMNPYQHGEVFVLDDGAEVDLDLGNYERFLDINLTRDNNITTGKVYRSVINKERKGDYLGKTVQIIPHITNEIRFMIEDVARDSEADVCVVELGGTVGDIESAPFLEAVRQLHHSVGHERLIFAHVTLVPVMSVVGEQKTKPTQHSVKELRAIGIHPDLIFGRAHAPLGPDIKEKIALFCDVPVEAVVSVPDAPTIYHVPMLLEEQGLRDYLIERLDLVSNGDSLAEWKEFVRRCETARNKVEIGLIGKYTHLKDSYISHVEALNHTGALVGANVNIRWLEAEDIEEGKVKRPFDGLNGIIVPGGFGWRGSEGKIMAAKWAREHKVPFLGICLGFQMATSEFSRNVLDLEDANSSEFNPRTPHPVIDLLPEQGAVKEMGGTMRLGSHLVLLDKGCKAAKLYGSTEIYERHRHRYEVNPEYIGRIEDAGLRYVGRAPDKIRMEVFELEGHPYYVGCQFHPELKSRPTRPAPLFVGLVRAAVENKKEREKAAKKRAAAKRKSKKK
ncbi:MAG: CTP synthase (glutamine hydrolyzing), partial [Thermoplasmata archaeon]|nr:CTP synthase (glutamine hydrolyzing) [Thermoplasmata archaeon]NIS12427.1 CTP synthase (glutamine hydrolyzing) [Thermoplasmata archaeon]NIS20350.1 CTP synthase (glutamine hydrolyzing) [Thermoplasmata archaeon]NIT77699.1 CTP synthase (glutamine hydrolyzing) [Thermoplasmata archaeon]NIU49437.1 CTP synthase (glutamine hydrolyzing) [Thermoplasmata archaeon]